MRAWKIVETEQGKVIVPTIGMYCPFCNHPLMLHDFKCYNQKVLNFIHCDIHMKCPYCGSFNTFGIPISEEEYKQLSSSELHGKVLKNIEEIREIISSPSEYEKVVEKLEKWGYW